MTDSPIDENNPAEHKDNPDSPEADAIAEAIQQACAEDADNAKPVTDLEAELATEKDRTLRLQAEMENLRSRTAREINDERRYAPLPIARDLLPVLDNINRALEAAEQFEAAEQSDESDSLLEGFKLVRQQLLTVLEQHHCKQIETVGQPFDPQIHEAILQQPSDEQPANHIVLETQAGYQLHDRVVRASQVIISSGPAEG